ncbi:toxin-antitoxin system HicB family antitoxin [Jonquetella anthropi]|uniref:toxin-antitoxin system HicB family antitoxin n=1 Tax=Jonquetella anthropi TaxID=428712 RepID=UPI0001B90F28|nr:toxin-antitoxin system HicB family antitoxin [Jonquetella anthropi]EEX48688.1 toxin-antitoxin system, antitoxin component, HicB domain protein [Jonquetella anthropi E3_33 E1]
MKNKIEEDIQRRIAQINAQPAEELTPEEQASLDAAMAMDDGTAVTLEELKQQLDNYSGRIVLRVPRSLHKKLKDEASVEGVSLNQYMLYKLAR